MKEFRNGFLGFVLSLGVFTLGFCFGHKTLVKPSVPDPQVEDAEKVQKEREQFEQDQKAFRALTGYSADVAYGLTKFPWEEDK